MKPFDDDHKESQPDLTPAEQVILHEQESLIHPATQVFFRAGLLACREYMARFVEHESPTIAASIPAAASRPPLVPRRQPTIGPPSSPPPDRRPSDLSPATDRREPRSDAIVVQREFRCFFASLSAESQRVRRGFR